MKIFKKINNILLVPSVVFACKSVHRGAASELASTASTTEDVLPRKYESHRIPCFKGGVGRSPARIEDQFKKMVLANDVIYYGESHDNIDHVKILREQLEKLIDSGIVDTFSTEAIDQKQQTIFNRYLSDKDASSNSEKEKEKEYFNKLPGGWTNREEIKHLFRMLKSKISAGKDIKICGIDFGTEDEQSKEGQVNRYGVPKKRVDESYSRLKLLPAKIQNELVSLTGDTIRETAEKGKRYDREILMAIAANECAAGRKKNLVHVGEGHANKASARSKVLFKLENWYPTSVWQKMMLPRKRFAIVRNVIPIWSFQNLISPDYAKQLPSDFKEKIYFDVQLNESCSDGQELLLETRDLNPDFYKPYQFSIVDFFDYVVIGKASLPEPTYGREY